MKDCFGRSLHPKYKEDGAGIGAFQGGCTTLKVVDFNLPSLTASQKDMAKLFYDLFAPWGEIVDVHFNPSKCVGLVKYAHRFSAEFAREAMMDQTLGNSDEPIMIKWAIDNPFDKKNPTVILDDGEVEPTSVGQKRERETEIP